MSFALDELSDRIRDHLARQPSLVERKMFGGRAFMVHGHMVVAAIKDGSLLARVGKDNYEAALARPGCAPMVMGEKTMTGFVHLDGDVLEDDDALSDWLDTCLAFTQSLPPK